MGGDKTGRLDRVKWVSLGEHIDYVMRPVLRGMCKYESTIDGTLSIADIALLNAAIDAYDENTILYREALE